MATSLNPLRVFLVVAKQYEEEAKELFKDNGVIVVSSHRFLGGVIGNKDSQKSYIHGKVAGVKCVQQLCKRQSTSSSICKHDKITSM